MNKKIKQSPIKTKQIRAKSATVLRSRVKKNFRPEWMSPQCLDHRFDDLVSEIRQAKGKEDKTLNKTHIANLKHKLCEIFFFIIEFENNLEYEK